MTLLRCRILLALFLIAGAFAATKTTSLNLKVVRETSGKPVRNAEVVLHFMDKDGRLRDEGMELKTHEDGLAGANRVPYGKVRVQVIAPGFRTFGEDFDVDKPNMEITIKLQKPAGQVSIYK